VKKSLKSYFQILCILVLCGLANFSAHSIVIPETGSTDNSINDTFLSYHTSYLEASIYSSCNTFHNHDDRNLLFEVVDPQEVEEFQSLDNSNLQSSSFETDFSRIQFLKNSFYVLKERSMRFKYNSTKPSSELLVRLQVFII